MELQTILGQWDMVIIQLIVIMKNHKTGGYLMIKQYL